MLKSIKYLILIVTVVITAACNNNAVDTDKVELKTYMDTISYIIGLDYGVSIGEEKIDVNQLAVYQGLKDGLAGESLLSDSAKSELIDEFNQQLKARLEEEGRQVLEKNLQEGKEFLEQNMKNEGVVVMPSGLQYKVLKAGTGAKPNPADSVTVHYRAMFINRDVFDMSYDRGPAGIRLNTVIKGLSEGIQQMNEGSIYELYVPAELAYGNTTFANVIPAGSTLIYSIELIEIVK